MGSGDSGGFNIGPSVQTVPLVFKYTKNTGQNQSLRFTNAASFFINKELTASHALRMVWRVSFNADEQELGYYKVVSCACFFVFEIRNNFATRYNNPGTGP